MQVKQIMTHNNQTLNGWEKIKDKLDNTSTITLMTGCIDNAHKNTTKTIGI